VRQLQQRIAGVLVTGVTNSADSTVGPARRPLRGEPSTARHASRLARSVRVHQPDHQRAGEPPLGRQQLRHHPLACVRARPRRPHGVVLAAEHHLALGVPPLPQRLANELEQGSAAGCPSAPRRSAPAAKVRRERSQPAPGPQHRRSSAALPSGLSTSTDWSAGVSSGTARTLPGSPSAPSPSPARPRQARRPATVRAARRGGRPRRQRHQLLELVDEQQEPPGRPAPSSVTSPAGFDVNARLALQPVARLTHGRLPGERDDLPASAFAQPGEHPR